MKKYLVLLFFFLSLNTHAQTEDFLNCMGQTKPYIINQYSKYYIVENTDSDIEFKQSDKLVLIFTFENSLCNKVCTMYLDMKIGDDSYAWLAKNKTCLHSMQHNNSTFYEFDYSDKYNLLAIINTKENTWSFWYSLK